MPGDDVITVTWRSAAETWSAKIPTDSTPVWVSHDDLPKLLLVAHDIGATRGMRVELWDDAIRPGGWVCGWPDPSHPDGCCGMPVESEPCDIHWPLADEEPAELGGLFAEAAATGRHPLGRQARMGWLPLGLLAVLAVAAALTVAGLMWATR